MQLNKSTYPLIHGPCQREDSEGRATWEGILSSTHISPKLGRGSSGPDRAQDGQVEAHV